jgi:hypothetical protein
MKINVKKSAKMAFLTITALLIATASAAVYNYMYQIGEIGVEGMTLAWSSGDDGESAGTTINGVTCSLTNLKGPPNGTRTYSDPVRLKNNAASGNTAFDLLINSVSGNTSYMDSIVVRIYSLNTTQYIKNVTIWSGGQQGDDVINELSIPAGHIWRFEWEIKWKATAQVGYSVTVELKIRVPA